MQQIYLFPFLTLIHITHTYAHLKNKVSTAPFSNEHAVTDVLLIDPEARVLNEFFLLLCVILVLRRAPKIVILVAVLIAFVFVSLL